MTRPVTAWAVVDKAGKVVELVGAAQYSSEPLKGRRYVKLTEHSAAKEAVVKAAVKWREDFDDPDGVSTNNLMAAVDRLQSKRGKR